jgi:hypothetical protein
MKLHKVESICAQFNAEPVQVAMTAFTIQYAHAKGNQCSVGVVCVSNRMCPVLNSVHANRQISVVISIRTRDLEDSTSSRPNFPSFQPYWRGDPITALASCAFIQIFVCKEVLNSCCLNVASQENLSCTELCSRQASDLCRNINTHKRDLEDEDS